MAIENIQKIITLDVYDHNSTPSTVKAIAYDNDTRYIAAEIRNEGERLDISPESDVRLTVIRPDKVGVSITGKPYSFEYSHGGGIIDPETGEEEIITETYYGVYAELTQAAISVAGIIYAQFKITSGSQILRTEIFQINNGRALDVEPDTWAGEYDRYDVIATELLERMEAAETKANQASSDIRDYADRIEEAESKISDLVDISAEGTALVITTNSQSNVKKFTPYVTDSASGSVAHFVDGADGVPMKSVKVNIAPVQSGSGDPSPSNVRAISGWDSVKVTRAGRNFCKSAVTAIRTNLNGLTATPNGDGSITVDGTSTATTILYFNLAVASGNGNALQSNGMKNLPNGTYRFGTLPDGMRLQIYGSDVPNAGASDAHFISDSTRGNFTISGEYRYNWVRLSVSSTTTLNNAVAYPALYLASDTDDTYEPYNGNTYEISLSSAGTVYGGTLDVTSGELTVDKKKVTIDGSAIPFTFASSNNTNSEYKNAIFGISSVDALQSATASAVPDMVSDKATAISYNAAASKTAENYGVTIADVGITTQTRVRVSIPKSQNVITVADANTWASSNQLTVVYPLTNALTYQLTATEIKSLLGINNVWSDAGDMDVEYRADTKLYIDKKLGG